MKAKNNESKTKPIVFANVLKIMASFAVVMIHVAAIEWYKTDGNTPEWTAMNIYDSICRWSVPIFVMVTGMLLLPEEKEITIQKIFTKYIKKVIILLIFWALIFSFYTIIIEGKEITDLKVILYNMIYGNYHLWYLYMLMGLYLITQFLKLITKAENKKVVEYFCALWLIFQCFLGTFLKIYKESHIQVIVSYMHINFVLEYVGYYLLGYYLNTYSLDKIKARILYGLGGIATIVIILATQYAKINNQEIVSVFYDFLSLPVALCSIAIFVGVKQTFQKKQLNEKVQKAIQKWTKLTLGVYLVHLLFIELMKPLQISILNGKTEITILLTTIIIYIVSIGVTFALSKIPKLGKYIV